MNKDLNLPLGKTDPRGWNIAHFAAKIGNKDEFNYLINEAFEDPRTSLCCKGKKCEGLKISRPFESFVCRNISSRKSLAHLLHPQNVQICRYIDKNLKSVPHKLKRIDGLLLITLQLKFNRLGQRKNSLVFWKRLE